MMQPPRWNTITPSRYSWEREALDFIREGLPDHEPYRAWSNFEFTAPDGAIYEVDLLVVTKVGLWLVEIKSQPGRVGGDAGTWIWEHDGRRWSVDAPRTLANRKAKALKSLLAAETRAFRRAPCPFIEAVVFLSAADLRCDLRDAGRAGVLLRDRAADHPAGPRDGILRALLERTGPGLDPARGPRIDKPLAKSIAQALEASGVRPSQRTRRVGECILGELLDEGPGYQDLAARHASFPDVVRRVRRYLVADAASEDERRRLRSAAKREFRTLQTLEHRGILAARDYKDDALGPALIFDHEAGAVGLDRWLATRAHRLGVDLTLDLLRQIAEALQYAHAKRIVHRALSPKSIVVFGADSPSPTLKLCYWPAATRQGTSATLAGTRHVEELIESPFIVYAAPEARLGDDRATEAADVFSLGAIAYLLFSGRPPAASHAELARTLRESKGLDLAAVVDGAGTELRDLVRRATHPDVLDRTDTVDEFLEQLERVEDELTTPEGLAAPHDARKGDRLLHGLRVERVLGRGSTARALLVEREEHAAGERPAKRRYVLKVALTPEDDERLRDEANVLRELRSEYIVDFVEELDFAGRVGLLLETAGDQTLAEYLRQEGSLSLDLLERFGDNLLSALAHLERTGQRHRDIKPENIGVVDFQKKRKQLVLFDFSLARAPLESIHLGTDGYLDPFLPLRPVAPGGRPRWDESAERYAAAVTLHELATGVRPRWGDGRSSPAETDAPLVIEAEQFDASVREPLRDFFRRALDREVTARFANAEEMLTAWRAVFLAAGERAAPGARERQSEVPLAFAPSVDGARLESSIVQLGLSTRAENALDRVNVVSVRDLLALPSREIRFMRGVGKKTLSEIHAVLARLRERFPDVEAATPRAEPDASLASLALEILHRRVIGSPRGQRDRARFEIRRVLLGDHAEHPFPPESWPTQTEVAERLDVSRSRVGQVIAEERRRWQKDPGLTALRDEILEELHRESGILAVGELIDAVLARRESEDTPADTLRRYASAVARAALEAEHGLAEPRYHVHRHQDGVWIALASELVRWAAQLGKEADRIAAADPLLASARAVQSLRSIEPPRLPEGVQPPSDDRLLRLAVRAAASSALSPRQEIYPRGMDAERALRLGAGAVRALGLVGAGAADRERPEFTPDEVRDRIAARYPEAGALPDPPALTRLLGEIGLEVEWDAAARVYRRAPAALESTSGSTLLDRYRTVRPAEREVVTPEIAAARQFEAELRHRLSRGSFVILTVRPSEMTACESELLRRFDLARVSIDERLIGAMRDVAGEKGIKDWGRVRTADLASRDSVDWSRLMTLVAEAAGRVEREILEMEGAALVVHPGLLARYDRMSLLEGLRDEVGRPGRLRSCFVLVPTDEQSDLPILDGREIPLLSPGQRVRVPRDWIENRHRGAAVS